MWRQKWRTLFIEVRISNKKLKNRRKPVTNNSFIRRLLKLLSTLKHIENSSNSFLELLFD